MSKRIGVAGILAIGVLAAASFAWACTTQPQLGVNPTSGSAGDEVKVSGADWSPGPVQIHWGSETGPLMGTATGPSFSVSVTIPSNASYGVHAIVANQPAAVRADEFAAGPGKASAPFSVVPAQSKNAARSGSSPNSGSSNSGPSPVAGAEQEGDSPDAVGVGGQQPTTATEQPTTATEQPQSGRSLTPGEERSARTARSGTGNRETGANVPVGASLEPLPRAARSVSGDLWSGFGTSDFSAELPADVAGGDPQSPALALGVGLLSVGAVALLAGLGVAEASRRRVTVRSGR